MTRTVLVVEQCPECDSEALIPAATREGTNFLCPHCMSCWHLERSLTRVVDTQTCPGCQLRQAMCAGPWESSTRGHDLSSTPDVTASPATGRSDAIGWNEIVSELYRSAREAGVGCSPPLS